MISYIPDLPLWHLNYKDDEIPFYEYFLYRDNCDEERTRCTHGTLAPASSFRWTRMLQQLHRLFIHSIQQDFGIVGQGIPSPKRPPFGRKLSHFAPSSRLTGTAFAAILYKDSCSDRYQDYIYVNKLGERIKPGYITQHFPLVLKKA